MITNTFRYLQSLICGILRKRGKPVESEDVEKVTKEYIDRFDRLGYERHGAEVTVIHSAIREYHRSGYLGHDDGTYSECAREVLGRLADVGLIVVPAPNKEEIVEEIYEECKRDSP